MERFIDLRSDTVTRPSVAMRRAMAEAVVGDDVLGDDPTVTVLQEMAAALVGMEAALFMPSGTMSNAVAIKVHTVAGEEILVDSDAHSMLYEAGNSAAIAQVLTRQFSSKHGVPIVAELAGHIHEESLHSPRTALILLENSHNRAGGAKIPLETHREVWDLAKCHGLAVHVDGARIFNAIAALHVKPTDIGRYADSLTFCLSKGLGCPVGSLLCGTETIIKRARRVRKMLGGGLRQVGILAAAGIYALENHIDRLVDDNANARSLATMLGDSPGLELQTECPDTNMVYIRTAAPAERISDLLKARHGVLLSSMGPRVLRAVTHMDVTPEDVAAAGRAIRAVCAEFASA